MIIFGSDMSTKACSIAIMDTETEKTIHDFLTPQNNPKTKIGEFLKEIYNFVFGALMNHKPSAFLIEDVFANSGPKGMGANLESVKILIKIQAITESAIYEYEKKMGYDHILVDYKYASSVRAMFGFNFKTVLTETLFLKKQTDKTLKKNPYKNMTYEEYLKNPNHYTNKFPEIDFNGYKKLRSVKPFDYAKKIVVIDYINKRFGTNFDYFDNDITDSYLNVLFLSIKLKEASKGKEAF